MGEKEILIYSQMLAMEPSGVAAVIPHPVEYFVVKYFFSIYLSGCCEFFDFFHDFADFN